MARKKGKDRSGGVENLVNLLRKPDLSILGASITSLPISHWRPNMMFFGAPDTDLRQLTGAFPATMRPDKTTHPLFVLQVNTVGHYVCPCSSKGHSAKQRYVCCGCRLEMKNEAMKLDSFLVEACGFTLPLDQRFTGKLGFLGLVPESCLIDERNRP